MADVRNFRVIFPSESEGKLKLVLPLGNLADPKKFTVYHMLEMAGLGKVKVDKRNPEFIPNDPEIEVDYLKPSDIAFWLLNGYADVGITGTDCIARQNYPEYGLSALCDYNYLEHIRDLGCGQVEWCFTSHPKRIEEVRALVEKSDFFSENIRDFVSNGDLLDLFLAARLFGNKKYFNNDFPPFLATENPPEARKSLEWSIMKIFTRLKLPGCQLALKSFFDSFGIYSPSGQTERFLKNAYFIYESVATGDSLKDHNGVILRKDCNSNVGIYFSDTLQDGIMLGESYGRAMQIVNGLESVVNQTDELCQISYTRIDGKEQGHVPSVSRIGIFGSVKTPDGSYMIAPKSLLKNPEKIFCNNLRKSYDIEIFDLASLYGYCPFFLDDTGKPIGGEGPLSDCDSQDKSELGRIRYFVPVQSKKLRKEHYGDGWIASSDGKGWIGNPRYKHLFENK